MAEEEQPGRGGARLGFPLKAPFQWGSAQPGWGQGRSPERYGPLSHGVFAASPGGTLSPCTEVAVPLWGGRGCRAAQTPPIAPHIPLHSPWGRTGTTKHRWVLVVWVSQWVLERGTLCWHQAGQEGTVPRHLRQRGSRTDSIHVPTLLGASALAWLPAKRAGLFSENLQPWFGGARQGTDVRCPPALP